jgi:hypothetical protein
LQSGALRNLRNANIVAFGDQRSLANLPAVHSYFAGINQLPGPAPR